MTMRPDERAELDRLRADWRREMEARMAAQAELAAIQAEVADLAAALQEHRAVECRAIQRAMAAEGTLEALTAQVRQVEQEMRSVLNVQVVSETRLLIWANALAARLPREPVP